MSYISGISLGTTVNTRCRGGYHSYIFYIIYFILVVRAVMSRYLAQGGVTWRDRVKSGRRREFYLISPTVPIKGQAFPLLLFLFLSLEDTGSWSFS
jgi:hypothetical protein